MPPFGSNSVFNQYFGSAVDVLKDSLETADIKRAARLAGLIKNYTYGEGDDATIMLSKNEFDNIVEQVTADKNIEEKSLAYTAVHNSFVDILETLKEDDESVPRMYSKEDISTMFATYLANNFKEPYAQSQQALFTVAVQIAKLAGTAMESCLRATRSDIARVKFDEWVKSNVCNLVPMLSTLPLTSNTNNE